MATQQVETGTVIAASGCTGNGTMTVTVTSARISTNPTAVSVAVTTADNTAALVALACRNAIALNSVVSNVFQVSGSGADIVLTEREAHANDTTLNIAIATGTATGITAAPTSTNTTAGDGLSNAYITLADIKAGLDITDTTDDTVLEDVINAVSRSIDLLCERHFYTTNSDETRYFTPRQRDQIWVGDLVSITSIATDGDYDRTYGNAWASTDYDLYPYNASLDGIPYYRIDIAPDGDYTFALNNKFVKIVGKWGWSSAPHPVQQACLLWSMRAWERHKTVLGTSSMSAFGTMVMRVPPPDPDVELMLAPYKLWMKDV